MGLKEKSGNFIRFIIYIIVIVLINLAGMTLFFRIDLTSNRIYSISGASKDVVSTLSEPLTINVFFTKNLPAPHNNTEKYLHDLLEEYSIYANEYFNYRFFDVSPEETNIRDESKTNREMARSYGINPVQIQVVEEDELKFKKAYMGLVLIHGDMVERIPTITSTDRLEYQLTTSIQKMNNKISALLRLPDKISIKLFLSSSLKIVAPYIDLQGLNELPERIENIVDGLNTKNYGKLDFRFLDPTTEPDLENVLQKYEILSLQWPEIPDKNIGPGKGSIGLVIEYGGKAMSIPLIGVLRLPIVGTRYQLADLDKMEEVINENIESLLDINEDLGYLADHDTPSLWGGRQTNQQGMPPRDSVSNFNSLVSQTYSINEISMSKEDIPESLNCFVIAGPKKDFSDYELFQIDQFLMRGKNLIFFLDSFQEITIGGPDQPFGRKNINVPLNTGIEKLLEHYGVSIRKSFVMDENCYKQRLPESMGGGEKPIYFVPFIMNDFINKDLLFIKDIKGLVVPMVSPVDINIERLKDLGVTAHELFSSSDKSWEVKEVTNLEPLSIIPPTEGEYSSMPLAYLLEGEFSSYYKDKPLPEKEAIKKDESGDANDNESSENKEVIDMSKIKSEGDFIAKGKPGKLAVIASSELLKDNIIDPEGGTTNSTFVLNLIDYMNNREATAVMRSKESGFNPLSESSGGVRAFIKYFNIIGLPVIVVLFGLFVLLRRHRRKKIIRMMFQQ